MLVSAFNDDNVVWGNAYLDADNVVGGNCDSSDCDNVVWGNTAVLTGRIE
jgi:hypothetical protein